MRKLTIIAGALSAAAAGLFVAWRRNPRLGTRFTNEVVNPFILERGASGVGRSELGTLEHVGRVTGAHRRTPIRPVATEDGFRIMVPLGTGSQWAQNVLAAGHCRLQWHDSVYELDEPVMLAAGEVPEIPAPVAAVLDRLGIQYLLLRRFGEQRGRLDEPEAERMAEPTAQQVPVGAGVA